MAGNILDVNTLAVDAPASPPTGYTKPTGSDQGKVVQLTVREWSINSGTQSIWYDNLTLTGSIIKSHVVLGTTNGSANGPCLVDASGNGYVALTSDGTGNIRFFRVVNGQLGTQIGSAITQTHSAGQKRTIRRDTTTGNMIALVNDVQVGGTYTDNTYNPQFAGMLSRGGLVRSLTSEYTPAQTVTSINYGNDIIEGAVGTAAVLSGFTSRPTSITTNQAGITCSNIGGTTNAPTFDLSGWTDGQPYPVLPVSVEFTFTYLAESAAGTETVTYSSDYTKTTFSSPVTDDNTYVTYWIDQDGHETDGATFYWTTFSDLSVASDGGITVTGTGQFTAWFRPASGATSGNMYEYIFTVVDGSIVSAESGLTSRGLTNTGLVNHGLVSRGL